MASTKINLSNLKRTLSELVIHADKTFGVYKKVAEGKSLKARAVRNLNLSRLSQDINAPRVILTSMLNNLNELETRLKGHVGINEYQAGEDGTEKYKANAADFLKYIKNDLKMLSKFLD